METDKLNAKGNARGGKNNTKTVLTAAGLSAAVGVASGAAIVKFSLKNKEDHDHHGEQNTSENVAEQNNSQGQQPEKPQQEQPAQTQTQTSNDDITTPQPTDSTNGTGEQPSQTSNETSQENNPQTQPSDEDEIDPDLIAQQIAGATETDPDDLDVPDLLTIDGMDIAYGPDGSEITVAMVRTPDGGQYMLADVDGDGVFSDVFDMEGNYVGYAEGNLTASDLQEAADPTGGYMAYNGMEPAGEDPSNDIVATDTTTTHPTGNLVAEKEEDPDMEDLLAQLLSSNDDSLAEVTEREMVVDTDHENTNENEDSADDDDDSEIEDDDSEYGE